MVVAFSITHLQIASVHSLKISLTAKMCSETMEPIMPVGTKVDFDGARKEAKIGGLQRGSKIVLEVPFVRNRVRYGFTIEGIFENITKPEDSESEGVTFFITSDPEPVKKNRDVWKDRSLDYALYLDSYRRLEVDDKGEYWISEKYWISRDLINSIKKIEEPPVEEPIKASEVRPMSKEDDGSRRLSRLPRSALRFLQRWFSLTF